MISKTSVQNVRGAEENKRPVLRTVSGIHSKTDAQVHYQAQARLAVLDALFAALDDKRTYLEVGDNAIQYQEQPETDPVLIDEPPGWVVMFCAPHKKAIREQRFDTFLEALQAATQPAV